MRINESVFILGSGKMGFYSTDSSDCNIYLVHDNDELAIIDTGTGESIEQICEKIKYHGFSLKQLKKILLTHIHADHAGGAALLKERTGAKVYVHYAAKDILKEGNEEKIDLSTAKKSGFYKKEYNFNPCDPDVLLKEDDIISIGNLSIQIVETPGHSRYDLSFYVKENKWLFSGDTIFPDGKISMINTQDFNLQKLSESISKLSKLNVDCLFPGHYHFILRNGTEHIENARKIFEKMGIPKNLNH